MLNIEKRYRNKIIIIIVQSGMTCALLFVCVFACVRVCVCVCVCVCEREREV